MFAGPNGSGKSSMKKFLDMELPELYVNADDIEQEIKTTGVLDLGMRQVKSNTPAIEAFFTKSPLVKKAGLEKQVAKLKFDPKNNKLEFGQIESESYWAAITADFIRQYYLLLKYSFSFETVMSSPDKIQLLRKAKEKGYRVRVLFVATDDPLINVARVRSRVEQGGHNVPEDKIISRYYRSLELLAQAIKISDSAMIFDNSGKELALIANIMQLPANYIRSEIGLIQLTSKKVPEWFKEYVLDKIS